MNPWSSKGRIACKQGSREQDLPALWHWAKALMGWDCMTGRQKSQPKQPGGDEEGKDHERRSEAKLDR